MFLSSYNYVSTRNVAISKNIKIFDNKCSMSAPWLIKWRRISSRIICTESLILLVESEYRPFRNHLVPVPLLHLVQSARKQGTQGKELINQLMKRVLLCRKRNLRKQQKSMLNMFCRISEYYFIFYQIKYPVLHWTQIFQREPACTYFLYKLLNVKFI